MDIDKLRKYVHSRTFDKIMDENYKPKHALYPLEEYFQTHTSNTIVFDREGYEDACEWTRCHNKLVDEIIEQKKMGDIARKKICDIEQNKALKMINEYRLLEMQCIIVVCVLFCIYNLYSMYYN